MPGDRDFPNRIDDEALARKAAEAEKPFRDVAREDNIDPSQKRVLGEVADRKGSNVVEEEARSKAFKAETDINGMKISVEWDEVFGSYIIKVPLIESDAYEVGSETDESKIERKSFLDRDGYKFLVLSKNPEDAKMMFDFASYIVGRPDLDPDNKRHFIYEARGLTLRSK